MYLAYKTARKKYKAHQEQKAAQQQEQAAYTGPDAQDVAYPNNTPPPTATYTQGVFIPNADPSLTPSPANHDKEDAKSKEKSPEQIAEKKRRRKYRLKLLFGLFAPFALSALDTTIIASALKFIAEDFNQLPQLNWIITAFNLTSSASLPLFAQLADIFGRHATLQLALAIITIGSALCTGSPTSAFPLLLLGRALQGVGSAGIIISVRTILADRVSLREYARNWSFFALLSGVSYGVGPVVGGYLTGVSWRWCFAVNLPVAVVGMAVVAWLLRGELVGPQEVVVVSEGGEGTGRRGRFWARLATVDYGGQLLFLWGVGLLVLAFTWAGGTYAWDSAAVLSTLVIGGVLTVAWVVYEWAMVPGRVMARIFPKQRAMMPWQLLMQRDIGILLGINFANGAAMFAVMYFMELYFTLVRGDSASNAGLSLLYFLPGLGVGVYSAMFFVNVWPRQTLPVLLLGTTSTAVGITVLARACDAENTNLIYGMMALTGYGIGLNANPGSLHGLAYFPTMTAPITCLIAFAMPFGGTVGLTIMSTVFNNKSGLGHTDPKTGIVWAFIAMMPIVWLAVLGTTFLGNVWIGKDGRHDVVHGAWLFSLLRGKPLERVTMARTEDARADDGGSAVSLKPLGPSRPQAAEDIERGH